MPMSFGGFDVWEALKAVRMVRKLFKDQASAATPRAQGGDDNDERHTSGASGPASRSPKDNVE